MAVTVRFLPDDLTVEAEPGEPLLQVAARAGVFIPTGCLIGSCHACEVEVVSDRNLDPPSEGDTIRACISSVPAGRSHLTINLDVDLIW